MKSYEVKKVGTFTLEKREILFMAIFKYLKRSHDEKMIKEVFLCILRSTNKKVLILIKLFQDKKEAEKVYSVI